MFTPPGVSVIWQLRGPSKICLSPRFSDITSGRVHLDVGWIERTTGPPGGTGANLAHPSVTHLGRTRPLVLTNGFRSFREFGILSIT